MIKGSPSNGKFWSPLIGYEVLVVTNSGLLSVLPYMTRSRDQSMKFARDISLSERSRTLRICHSATEPCQRMQRQYKCAYYDDHNSPTTSSCQICLSATAGVDASFRLWVAARRAHSARVHVEVVPVGEERTHGALVWSSRASIDSLTTSPLTKSP